MNEVPLGENTESWVVRQDGAMYHDKQQKGKLPEVPQEGDVLVRSVIHVGDVWLDTSYIMGCSGKICRTCRPSIKMCMVSMISISTSSGTYRSPTKRGCICSRPVDMSLFLIEDFIGIIYKALLCKRPIMIGLSIRLSIRDHLSRGHLPILAQTLPTECLWVNVMQ